MKLLLIHQNYPGQFMHLQQALLARGDQLTAMGKAPLKGCAEAGIATLEWSLRRGNSQDGLPLIKDLESKFLRAEVAAEAADQARRSGYTPDLIVAHPGWGETLFLRDVWPDVPQLHYLEFDYQQGLDVQFDPEFAPERSWRERARQRVKAANTQLTLQSMTWGITPTRFQWSSLPAAHRNRISVLHDGINLNQLKPNPNARMKLPNGLVLGSALQGADPVLTFVNRTFEPYRGVHRLMRALPEMQRRHPRLQTLLIGRDTARVSYGAKRQDGRGWLATLKDELGDALDWSRIHAPGYLKYHQFVAAMQLSAAHVYFTYPFVLSWSLLEAMACGAAVIGSRTAPVEEVIDDGVNGLLVDFFDQDGLIEAVSASVRDPQSTVARRLEARKTVEQRYGLETCRHQQIQLIDSVANGLIGAGI